MIEVQLRTIKINDTGDRQYISLGEVDGERLLTIVIGHLEVHAIRRGVNGEKPPRPMTHDLLGALLEGLDATLERVDITELREGTYYALVRVRRPDDTVVEIDARPSDAIALAVVHDVPLFVAPEVMEAAATYE